MTDPAARPCAIKRRIALILGSCERTERTREQTAEEIAEFLQRLNDRVSGWDGIILLGEVIQLLRGYEEHHMAQRTRIARQVASTPEGAASQMEAIADRLAKAERNGAMAKRLEDLVDRCMKEQAVGANPVEVLRSLAIGMAARHGLTVDHAAFDSAAAVLAEVRCIICEDRAHQCEACARAQRELGR